MSLLTLVLVIAGAWTALSLMLVSAWVLALEIGRRTTSVPDPIPHDGTACGGSRSVSTGSVGMSLPDEGHVIGLTAPGRQGVSHSSLRV